MTTEPGGHGLGPGPTGPDARRGGEDEAARAADRAAAASVADEPGALPGLAAVVPLAFVEVVMALPSTHPIVILRETDPPHRELRIPIGLPEGTAIAYAAQAVTTPRPMTHDLFLSALQRLGAHLEVVRITAVRGSTYLAELVCSTPSGQLVLECRPSDALALALRQRPRPAITAASEVLDEMGIGSR